MTTISAALRRCVIQRADNRCEYCGISQVGQVATFHIDHIIPAIAGGETIAENLALACVSCSLRKGARQNIKDVVSGEVVSIFQPASTEIERAFCLGWSSSFGINGNRSSNCPSAGFESIHHVSDSRRRNIARSSSTTLKLSPDVWKGNFAIKRDRVYFLQDWMIDENL